VVWFCLLLFGGLHIFKAVSEGDIKEKRASAQEKGKERENRIDEKTQITKNINT
jgi:hypothetical protein